MKVYEMRRMRQLLPPAVIECRYSEHLLKYVFKFDALDIPSLASAFGLVKLPKVR